MFFESEYNLSTVINLFPEFYAIVEVEGGYIGFLTKDDLLTWKCQR